LKFFIYLLFLFIVIPLFSNSIKGTLLQSGNREPIAYASVKLISQSQNEELEEYTKENGSFVFNDLKAQKYILIISEISGYENKEFEIELKENQDIKKTIFLKKSNVSEYNLNIKKKKDKNDINKRNITKEELTNVAGTKHNFVKLLEKLPGVSRNNTLNSDGIVIRGTGSTNSRIFINGHYIPILYHFAGITPIFNSELIENIDFYPGNYPIKYGKAIGGVVNVNIRDANTLKNSKNTHGYLDINMTEISTLIEYPINNKSGFAITFRKSLIDKTFPLIFQNNDISRRFPIYYDWQLRYNYAFSRKNKISFTHFGSNDTYKFLSENSSKLLNYDDYSAKSFLIVNIFDWYLKINKKIKSNFSLSFQYSDNSFKIGEFVKVRNTPYLAIMKEDLNIKVSKNIKLTIGTENWASRLYYYAEVPVSIAKNYPAESTMGDYNTTNYFMTRDYYLSALYSDLSLYFHSFGMSLGVRGEYLSYNNSFYIDPRLNSFYKITKDFLIKLGVGIFHQPPFEYQVDKNFGNPNLNNQYSIQYLTGIKYENNVFLTTLDLFYNDQKNLVVRALPEDHNYSNDGQGKAYGAEFLIKYPFKKRFSGWISYTLMRAIYRKSDKDDWNLFDYDQTHILNIVAMYKLFSNINVSISLRYNTGNPYTPVTGSVFDSDKNKYIPIYANKNSERLKNFFQLDFKINKNFVFECWKLSLYLDIQNITNYKNEEGKIYNHNYTNFKIVEAVPFFPSIGIKGNF